jgi:ATP/maltotriose-dependent transcriptional regulator MalT
MATAVTELPFVTRILRPRRRRNTIRRERLEDSLQRALDHRVVCVWGPAGYGKTTVVESVATF